MSSVLVLLRCVCFSVLLCVVVYRSPYCASKYGVEAVTDCLRREIDSHGIAVVCVEPAFVESDMPAGFGIHNNNKQNTHSDTETDK